MRKAIVNAALSVSAVISILGAGTAAASTPLRTGVDATFAPHAMVKLDGGLQGFNIDLGNALAKQLGREIQTEGTEFSGLIPGLNAKKYDFVLAPVTANAERAKSVLFTEGYLNTDFIFVQKKTAADIKSLEELKGKTIAVNKGSAYEQWVRENADKYGFKFDVYGSNADAVQAVQSGRADANLAGNTVSMWVAKQNPTLKTTYTIETGLVWALAFRVDDKTGRDQMGNALKCLKLDGTVSKLAQKWFGFTPKPGSAAVTVAAGQGIEGLDGYDATSAPAQCK